MNRPLTLFSLLALSVVSCSLSNPIPLGTDALDEARLQAASGDWEECWDTLRDLDSDDLDRSTLVEYSLLAGDAGWETERFGQSLRYYEQFLSLRGPAADSRLAEQRTFQLASEMLDGKHRTLKLFPNRWRGRSALQNLAAFVPESPYAPEALATVANYSYERERYDEAQLDYQLLLARYRNTEWGDLATFRLGMCGYYAAQDARTNRPLIQVSRQQLEQYMRLFPDGQFRAEAEGAVTELLEFEAEYFLYLAAYYDRIDYPTAAARYLREATNFEGTAASARASEELAAREASASSEEAGS